MDGYLRLLFIQENTPTGVLIQRITGGEWSHVAVYALGGLVEAVPPRVTVSSIGRYLDCRTEIADFYVPDLNNALREAERLVGNPYGLLPCLSGGLYDVFRVELIVPAGAVDCAQLAVRAIRAGGGSVRPELPDSCFTPQGLYAAAKMTARMATG
jgi:hypothetical protein